MDYLTTLNSRFTPYGATIIVVPGIDDILADVMAVEFDFPVDGRMVPGEPTWYMIPKFINTKSDKRSLFMFDPLNHPEPYGESLRTFIKLLMSAEFDGHTLQHELDNIGLSVAVGTHYYEPGTGYLEQHNDVNYWSCICSDGSTSLKIGGEWVSLSKNQDHNPTHLLPPNSVIVMSGLARHLLGVGVPVLHRVDLTTTAKRTIGCFLEHKNKNTALLNGMTINNFNNEYFGVTPMSANVEKLKHEQVTQPL